MCNDAICMTMEWQNKRSSYHMRAMQAKTVVLY
jgi:hypothetical protein